MRSEEVPSATEDEARISGDPVAARVFTLVSELTGYPDDLLDVDLDLEADLGVDTVKQAEVFAAVRAEFGVERDDSLRLRDFPTLNHVIGFVHDRATVLPAGTVAPEPRSKVPAESAAMPVSEAAPAPVTAEPTADAVAARVVAMVSGLTGYPEDLLDLDLDLEADLGIDTVKQAEVFAALRGEFGIERDENLQLRDFPTLAHVIGFMRDRAPASTGPAPAAAAAAPDPAPAAPAGESGTATTEPAAAAGPAPAAAPVSEAAPAPVTAEPTADAVAARVVAMVSGLTGYPEDLLDLDLDLEADLGIDTVKQAEVFAALRGEFGIERDENLQLRDFPTLAHVIGFMRDRAPASTGPAPAAAAAAPAPAERSPGGNGQQAATAEQAVSAGQPATGLHIGQAVTGSVDATGTIPRRVPVPVLRPPLDQCVPTGVQLGQGVRVVLMPDGGGIALALADRLTKRGVEVLTLDPESDRGGVEAALDGWLDQGPVHGLYWLPALDDEGDPAALDARAWHAGLERRVKLLATATRRLYDALAGPDAFLISATRLGGLHGYGPDGATAPLGGAVTGFTKAFGRERPDTLVKAVDFAPGRKTAALADLLIAETLTDPGCVEVGRPPDGTRWSVGLREVPFPQPGTGDTGGMELGSDSVFVVTGAAGSIVSAITADLASASGGTFHLLDLTPEPDPNDADLRAFVEDRDGFTRTLADRFRERGERPTPVMIGKELARHERLAAALAAIQAVQDAGGTARYHCVDLTDLAAVAAVMDRVGADHARVDVLLHAGGLEISHSLPDKAPAEYDLVFDVKADGWFNLLHAAGDLPIATTVAFSSIAGRFGNAGQTDYSAANDLLCKLTANLPRTRPGTRGIVLDWTAWGGIGMATRGSIPTVMAMAGIDMLPPEAGIAWIRRELTSSDRHGEVVVAGALGALLDERHPTGGLEPATVGVSDAGVMVDRVEAWTAGRGLVTSVTLDPNVQGFLADHRIEGTAVLPGVMGIEAFAEVAHLAAPEHHVVAVEDVDFLAPFKFYRGEPRAVTVSARLRPDGGDLVAECRLEGSRTLPGQEEPQTTVHFTGRVRLAPSPLEAGTAEPPGEPPETAVTAGDIYRIYFHGPTYQVLTEAWRQDEGERCAGSFAADLPANHQPADAPTVTDPRLLELCFQISGVWEIGQQGRLALPQQVGAVQIGQRLAGAEHPVRAVTEPQPDGTTDAVVTDARGRVLLRLSGYRTVELPPPVDDERREPLARAVS